jgi:hemoglobin-like flavoprotein
LNPQINDSIVLHRTHSRMGNTCPGSKSSFVESDVQDLIKNDRVKDQPSSPNTQIKRHGVGFMSTYSGQTPKVPIDVLVEHFQPYEFPICPVINSDTQAIVKQSWANIINKQYDSNDTPSGKMSGASYFYNYFFTQLFSRLEDFSRIFPDIKSRADIFSKVMAFCISIRIEEIKLIEKRLEHLGHMHSRIIHHPHLFGIYATNIHSTVKHCLGDGATNEIMSAWLHLLSFILRGMLPSYFKKAGFSGFHEGAVNVAPTINEDIHEEIHSQNEMKSLQKKLNSRDHTEPQSRNDNLSKTQNIREPDDSNIPWETIGGSSTSPQNQLIANSRTRVNLPHTIIED